MSVGAFMGIQSSYTEGTQGRARAYIEAINRALQDAGLPEYQDPPSPPQVYSNGLFGRSALDHHSASCLASLSGFTDEDAEGEHLRALAENPYRMAFLPIEFDRPLRTDYSEPIGGEEIQIQVGSACGLLRELRAIAPALGIPLEVGELTDSVADRINDFAPLDEEDTGELAEDERTAWLLLYEGARLSIQHDVALSLAG